MSGHAVYRLASQRDVLGVVMDDRRKRRRPGLNRALRRLQSAYPDARSWEVSVLNKDGKVTDTIRYIIEDADGYREVYI